MMLFCSTVEHAQLEGLTAVALANASVELSWDLPCQHRFLLISGYRIYYYRCDVSAPRECCTFFHFSLQPLFQNVQINHTIPQRMIDWLFDWLIALLIVWLIDWSTDWSLDWLIDGLLNHFCGFFHSPWQFYRRGEWDGRCHLRSAAGESLLLLADGPERREQHQSVRA